MSKRFESKVVWITGGGSGIGRALALAFADQGADVAVSGRRLDRLEAVALEIEERGGRGLALQCDVTDEDEVSATADQVVAELGAMDVAVANAGFAVAGPIESLTAEAWRRQLDVNVVGVAMTARHALPYLRARQGRLALVGSVSGFIASAKQGPYTASKFAVRAIAETLSIELAGSGVSCTALHPGFVESEIAQVDNEGHFDPDRADKRPEKLMWTAEDAARSMLGAIHRRKREHIFTGHGKLAAAIGRHLPSVAYLAQARSRRKKRK